MPILTSSVTILKKILTEPLVHFLVGGFILFVLYHLLNPVAPTGNKTIVVNESTLTTFIQYRTNNFDPAVARQRLKNSSQNELERLIADFVREEALYREATKLGLDKDDYVLRQRLIQKVEFMAKGLSERRTPVSDDELLKYYDKNSSRYEIDQSLTFTHVFFSAESGNDQDARNLAEEKLRELNLNKVKFSDASQHGNLFAFSLNYVDRSPSILASHFGQSMSEVLSELSPTNYWQGPYRSEFGYHLVLMTKNASAYLPTLDSQVKQVTRDYITESELETQKSVLDKIVSQYETVISFDESS
ncbi:MAG: hypothetical protein ACI82A_001789 [Candidatus Azotimanducaceae bacterium]